MIKSHFVNELQAPAAQCMIGSNRLNIRVDANRLVTNRLDATKIGGLLAASPQYFIEFEYKDGNRYVPFAQASQGQQAAALLDLLLKQQAGSLIIDQPEADLDNRVIMDVANLLHSSKMGRQLIFATHNANFVVNGDADKVFALAPGSPEVTNTTNEEARIRIEVDGAIDVLEVRKAITDTLEGEKRPSIFGRGNTSFYAAEPQWLVETAPLTPEMPVSAFRHRKIGKCGSPLNFPRRPFAISCDG